MIMSFLHDGVRTVSALPKVARGLYYQRKKKTVQLATLTISRPNSITHGKNRRGVDERVPRSLALEFAELQRQENAITVTLHTLLANPRWDPFATTDPDRSRSNHLGHQLVKPQAITGPGSRRLTGLPFGLRLDRAHRSGVPMP